MYHNYSYYIFAYNSWLPLPYVVYFLCVFPSYCIYMNIYKEKAFGSIFIVLLFLFSCLVFYIFVSFCNLFLFWLCLSPSPLFQMLFLSSMKPKLNYHISLCSFFSFLFQIVILIFGISPFFPVALSIFFP